MLYSVNGVTELDQTFSKVMDGGNGLEPVAAAGMIMLPLAGTGTLTTQLDQQLMISASCGSALTDECDARSSFSDTVTVGGAYVVDANGKLVSGATITSASGYDYTQSLSPESPVPEPNSLSLLAIGALLLLGKKLPS